MATLIDQRVQIPAPTHAVWAILADSTQIPRWRVDCQQIHFMTPRQFGVGMQRQCVPPRGKPTVEEITAWYEGLGYEYQITNNRRYRSWRARLRLQAVPEGTVVQWTITYEPRGIINRILNAIGGRAEVEEESADSLRNLRRMVEALGIGVEQRKRQTLQPVQKIVRTSTQPIVVPTEDAEADTKPRKPEGLQEALDAMDAEAEKAAEAHAIPAPPPEAFAPPQPISPPTPAEPIAPTEPEKEDSPTEPKKPEALPPGMPESLKATPPRGVPKVDLAKLRFADEVEDDEDDRPELRTQQIRPGMPLPPPTQKQDTGEISIWEAFGIAPPSKADNEALDQVVKRSTGEYKAVTLEEDAAKAEQKADSKSIQAALRDGDTITFSPLFQSVTLRVRFQHLQTGLRSQQARDEVKLRDPLTDAENQKTRD